MKNHPRLAKTTLSAMGLLCSLHFALAVPTTTFTDRATWSHETSLSGFDDFESYNWHTGVDNGKVLAWSASTSLSQATYTATGVLYGVESLTYDAAFLASQYILWQEGGQGPGPNRLTIELPTPARTLGFDFAMFYGEVATYNIALNNGLTFNVNTKLQGWNFFGLVSEQPFQTVSITAGLYPVIDNFAWGQIAIVPEPSATAMLAAALALTARTNSKVSAGGGKVIRSKASPLS